MNLNDFNHYLSAYWNFDELNGTRLDLVNNIPLYSNNNVESKTGIRNTSASFNGGNYLNTYNGWYVSNPNGFLFSAWVFFDNEYISSTTLNSKSNNIAYKGNYFSVYTDDYGIFTAKINNTTLTNNYVASTDKWYHVTVGASHGFLFFSVRSSNGLIYSTNTYASLETNTDDFILGKTMKGRIDETAFWVNPQITSINQFLEIENEIYQNGKCLIYNNFKKLWEIAVLVNGIKTFDPIINYPDSSRPKSLSNVIISEVISANKFNDENDASNNKSTINSINSQALSLGILAPGETSKTKILRLNVPNSKIIKNIKMGLINTGGIPFTNQTFGITTRNYYDEFLTPDIYFQGISDGTQNSSFNVAIPNISATLSYYVYLNIKIPQDFIFCSGTIRIKYWFDYA